MKSGRSRNAYVPRLPVGFLLTVALLAGCGGDDATTDAEKRGSDEPAAVDRTDPEVVARAVLKAYADGDVGKLAEHANEVNRGLLEEIAEGGETHPRYASIFSGWRMEAVKAWDGELHGVRYRDAHTAAVKFGEAGDEAFVVMLEREGDEWRFEDVNSPSKEGFESLPETPGEDADSN